uniref:Uncharacterized protein n=1 Tax=Avena sativa TaxID=4498 RepID=A0ACD5VB00_AVESA
MSSHGGLIYVLIRGRGEVREIKPPVSASLGAMRPLVAKLNMLLLRDGPQECFSERVKDRMCLLKHDIEKISSYLDDLSEVEDPPETANCWMNEARDMSYDMEDYMDSLIFMRLNPSLVANNIKSTRWFWKLFGHAKTPKTLVNIEATLSEFRMHVQEVIARHQRYDLHSCSTLRRRFTPLGPKLLPTSYEETADIVIDGRMNDFINSLANDGDQELKVLSVLGSACLGKTTLARILYNIFGKRCHCRAFIRLSKKPDMKRTFCDMLSQLQQQNLPQDCEEIDLIDNIKKYLQNRRYLIILDDVWATSVWDVISHAFPNGSHGSRIITTTQIEDVALTCCCYQAAHVFEMKPLDDDHSRKLFFNRLSGSESYCPEQFKEVSNEIVEMCGGLPLATISIASLIASQPVISTDLLTYIHHSLSCLSANSTSERTRQVLNVSFSYLPHYLKTCLLYLSMYQKGYKFCNDDLVKQWMAEGFIDTTGGQDIKKVAESYLDQLIDRRFIQPIHINYNNEVLSYAVHDTVHDLIAHKSEQENFIVTIDYNRKNLSLSYKVRRLSLLFGNGYTKTPADNRNSQVRSLRYFGSFECLPCITDFKLLRVLNLELSGHCGDDDPVDLTGISELFQLRYLKIASHVCIKLPYHGLQLLETLDIMDARVASVPWDIHLPHLLHLSLPVEGNLLDWSVSKGSLGNLNYLQNLNLSNLSTPSYVVERSMEALGSLIGGHGSLKTIQVVAHGSLVKNDVVPSKVTISWGCMAPPPLLQRFECSLHSCIVFYWIPKWVTEHGNLRILKISVRELMMSCVDILRGLPALTTLSLYVQRAPIKRIIFHKAGFSALKFFKLRFTSGIAWLAFEADSMPNLWKLKLVFNAIPQMDQHLLYYWNQGTFKRHQRGTAVISIEHMPGLKEISVEFGGAAANVEYALRTFVSNHRSNPNINMQPVTYNNYGNESTEQKKQPSNEILEEEPDEYDKALDRTADKRSRESSSCLHVFTLNELVSATSNFSKANFIHGNRDFTCLGVYKGSFDGNFRPGLGPQEVVIIRYPNQSDKNDCRCLSELEYLGTVCHPHLVKLAGFCIEGNCMMLVYEYTTSISLNKFLIDYIPSLPLLLRLEIAVGAAKGLAFLHEADKPLVHGYFGASCVLIYPNYSAKLLGFRMVKESRRRKAIMKDVYNFGVVLLALLAGRPSIDTRYLSRKRYLVKWSRPYLRREDDKMYRIMDPGLKGQYSVRAACGAATVAHRCLNRVPKERPCMRDVVDALEPLLALKDDDCCAPTTLASGSGIEEQSKTTKLSHVLVKRAKAVSTIACLR